MKNKLILLGIVIFTFNFCSKKVIFNSKFLESYYNFYIKEIEKSYDNDLNKSFYKREEWIKNGKFLLDREVYISKKVLDSLNIADKQLIIIEKRGLNYSGSKHINYIFYEDDVYFYVISENFTKNTIYKIDLITQKKDKILFQNKDLNVMFQFLMQKSKEFSSLNKNNFEQYFLKKKGFGDSENYFFKNGVLSEVKPDGLFGWQEKF